MRPSKIPSLRARLNRRSQRHTLGLVLLAISQMAALCTPLTTPKVAYLAHAEDLVDFAEWLRWQAPAHTLAHIEAPVIPFASLPLTTTGGETALESVVTFLSTVSCTGTICSGNVSASGPHSSGFEQFALRGTWTTDGQILQAEGSTRQSDGLVYTQWRYDGSTLRTAWTLPYAQAVTGILTESLTALTYATRWVPVDQCQMLDRSATTTARCTPDGITHSREPATDLTWPTAAAEQLRPDGAIISTYADSTTGWTVPVMAGASVNVGQTVFGARSTLRERSTEVIAVDWNYSRCDVYHSLTDTQYGLPATEPDAIWQVERDTVTYNNVHHSFHSELRPGSRDGSPDNLRAFVRVDLPGATKEGGLLPFVASGAFTYSRDKSGWFGLWRGSLQTEFGDVLLIELRRDPIGHVSVSGTFDDTDTEQSPDEEMSIQLRLDGSGEGIAFKLRSLEGQDQGNVDIGETVIERIEIPFAFPQPGARLTERPQDCP